MLPTYMMKAAAPFYDVDPRILKIARAQSTNPQVSAILDHAIKRASVVGAAKAVGGTLMSQKTFEAAGMAMNAKKRLSEPVSVVKEASSKTVVIDFDGTLSTYASGWQGIDKVDDPPVDGWRPELESLVNDGYELVVVSSRCAEKDGINAIKEWLKKHKLDDLVTSVQAVKPPHKVVIDDRAIPFTGSPSGLADKIRKFKSWTEVK